MQQLADLGSKQSFAAIVINVRIGSVLLVQKNIWLFECKSACLDLQLDDKALPISPQINKVVQKVVLWLGSAGTKQIFI